MANAANALRASVPGRSVADEAAAQIAEIAAKAAQHYAGRQFIVNCCSECDGTFVLVNTFCGNRALVSAALDSMLARTDDSISRIEILFGEDVR